MNAYTPEQIVDAIERALNPGADATPGSRICRRAQAKYHLSRPTGGFADSLRPGAESFLARSDEADLRLVLVLDRVVANAEIRDPE